MRITWKDGITTLAAAGAIVLERAHFDQLDIPLFTDARWAILGIGTLTAVGYIFGYLLDETHNQLWSVLANFLGAVLLGICILGLFIVSSDLVVVAMFGAVAFWLISIVSHAMTATHVTHGHV